MQRRRKAIDVGPAPVGTGTRRARRGPGVGVALATVYLVVLTLAAFGLGLVDPTGYEHQELFARHSPPKIIDLGSRFLLGADHLGRDEAARILAGARVSLAIGLFVVSVAGALGTGLGLVAGYLRGAADAVIMRIVDVVLAFPSLLIAMVVLYIFGGGLVSTALVLAASRWPVFARVARAEVLRLRELEFVQAARAIGAPSGRIMRKEVLPNLLPSLLVLTVTSLPQVMLAEAGLSFLGLGIQPPDTSWGLMIAQASPYIRTAWWTIIFPGLGIAITTLAIGLLGSGLLPSDQSRVR